MKRADPVYVLQVGLHVLRTSIAFEFLLGGERTNEKALSLGKALRYFANHVTMLNALLNEEPIYIAGDIVGVSQKHIDAMTDTKWLQYREVMKLVSGSFASEEDSIFLRMLGDFIETQKEAKLEFFIEDVNDDRLLVS